MNNVIPGVNKEESGEGVSYYSSKPIYLDQNITGKQVKFNNAIFIYEGSNPVNGDQCNAKKINATYSDYKGTELKHFKIIIDGETYIIDSCWPPPYTGPIDNYPEQRENGTGIEVTALTCPAVYLWADENRSVGIMVRLTEGQWHTTTGKIYRLFCNDGGTNYLVKK